MAEDPTDSYGRIKLPDHISTYGDVARTARALTDYFQEGEDDKTLARLANSIASVAEARQQNIDDESRYGSRVTYVDSDGDPHTAIVLEPEVADMHADEAWDPYHQQMVDPQKAYPMGTVQLVYPSGDKQWPEDFVFSSTKDLEVATSVTPAKKPDMTYCYYAGWDYAINNAED